MYRIIREIHFSYGHRLVNYEGKCARLHGHNARARIELASEELNEHGMVMDFFDVKQTIGKWIDETLDHRLLLSDQDPLVAVLREAGEPLVLTKGNPTAEAIARLIYDKARSLGLPVTGVSLWETPNACASYHG